MPQPLPPFLGLALSRLNSQATTRAGAALRHSCGLGLTQARVLLALQDLAPCRPADVVGATGLDKGLLSRTVTGLRDAGWVAAQDDPYDTRAQILTLTQAGTDRAAQAAEGLRLVEEELLAPLTVGERAQLSTLLERLFQDGNEG